jgi:tripartite-type tricarboxylate transporter receptor subunit TctC
MNTPSDTDKKLSSAQERRHTMHSLSRRTLAAVAAALLAAPFGAAAQEYPTRAVTVIVPQAPGGTNDIVARVVGEALSRSLGQPFVIENRPGAGGNIGTQAAARAKPDGYTLLVTISSSQAINPALYKKVPFDPVKDFAPITLLGSVPNVLVANTEFPPNTLPELIALAKAKPGELKYASAGNGTLNHLLGEMLKTSAGIDLVHVPYKGVAPAVTDVLGGFVNMGFASLPSVVSHLRNGKLKAFGVSTAQRSPTLPDVPAIGETVPDYAGDLWVGLFAVAGTPKDIIAKLHAETVKALGTPAVREKLETQGVEVATSTPEELAAKLQADLALWAKVVKESGATVD